MATRLRKAGFLIVGILALLVGIDAQGGGGAAPASAGQASDTYVLVVGDPALVRTAVQAAGGEVRFALSDGTIAVRVPSAQLASLSSAPGIRQLFADDAVSFTGATDSRAPEAKQAFQESVHAPEVWAAGGIDGSRVTVAVLDTGISPRPKNSTRIVASPFGSGDSIGHGTFVAGIIAGDDIGGFEGIAPDANLLNIKVVGADGSSRTSDLIRGVDWAVQNRTRYNIRVLNISATTSTPSSYLTSPLDAAVERAWFSGIVVVAAAGNSGANNQATSVAPANDPFVITVGAFDDAGTNGWGDDRLTDWSSRGTTVDNLAKPDVVAPGRHLISWLANGSPLLAQELPTRIVDSDYIQLSGTSAAAPVVSGVVALMLERNPFLTPDQVKARLVSTGRTLSGSSAPRVDARDAVFSWSGGSANSGMPINLLLAAATGKFDLKRIPASKWATLNRASITWDAMKWDPAQLQSITWDSITWDSITWDSITWDSITWDVVHFDVVEGD